MSRLTASRSRRPAGGPEPGRDRLRTGPRSGAEPAARVIGAASSLAAPAARCEESSLRALQEDDGALARRDDAGDVGGGQPAHHRRRARAMRRAVHPHHLPHLVHQHADALAVQVEDHEPGLLADRRVELEPLAEVHHRHRAALVADHALQEIGGAWAAARAPRSRRMRSTWRMSNANSWVPTRKVTSWMSSPVVMRPRFPPRSALPARRDRGAAPALRRAAGHAERPTAAPRRRAPAGPRRTSTDSASSTSRQMRWRPPRSTSTPASLRAGRAVAAVEQRAERCTSGTDPAADDRRRRASPARATGTANAVPGIEHLDDLLERRAHRAAAGAHEQVRQPRRAHRAAHPAELVADPRRRSRPTGSTWSAPPGLHRRVRHAEDRGGSRDPARCPMPPASWICRSPSAPSRPSPVSTTPTARRPKSRGDRPEQRIGGGPHAPHRRAPGRARAARPSGARGDAHMIISRRDVGGVRQRAASRAPPRPPRRRLCAASRSARLRVNLGGMCCTITHRRPAARGDQLRHHLGQRARPAGGGGDGHAEPRPARQREQRLPAGAARAAAPAPAAGGCRRRAAAAECVEQPRRRTGARRPRLRSSSLATRSTAPSSSARIAAAVPGPAYELTTTIGPRRLRHDVADGAEAVELRHLEVHRAPGRAGARAPSAARPCRCARCPRRGTRRLPSTIVGQQPPEEGRCRRRPGPCGGSEDAWTPCADRWRLRPGRPPRRAAPCGRSRRRRPRRRAARRGG